jgi:hypothetical protein
MFNEDLSGKTNMTETLGGLNTHASFNQTNPCIEFVFGHRENAGSAPYMWIYDGSFHQVFHNGEPVQGNGWSWKWQGDKIAFEADGYLYTIAHDGSTLTDTGLMGYNPQWSPDGKNLAFSSLAGFMSIVDTTDWTHVHDYVETPMTAPRIDPGQKFVCGSEYCFDLRDNYSFASTTAWNDFEDLAFEPAGNTELIVHSKFMEIIGGNTFAGEWYNPDWYSTQKAEFIPIK